MRDTFKVFTGPLIWMIKKEKVSDIKHWLNNEQLAGAGD